MLGKYEKHVEVGSYSVDVPTARRPTKGRRVSRAGRRDDQEAEVDDGKGDTIKVGRLRSKAIENILKYCPEASYAVWEQHLDWAGKWKQNVLTDDILCQTWFWPGSRPAQENMPSDQERQASIAGARLCEPAEAGYTSAPLNYEMDFSVEDFNFMLTKAIHSYEEECQVAKNEHHWMRARPSKEGWST